MRIGIGVVATSATLCLFSAHAFAQRALTLAEVLARARDHAPQIVSARLAIEESRAQLIGASLRHQSNPDAEFAAGNRSGPTTRFTDFELGLGQNFEPGSRRTERIAVANFAIAQRSNEADETVRAALRSAATAYYRSLHAAERIRLLTAAQELAASVYAAADRRFRAGDIPVLDMNIARVSLARVRADREAGEAARATAFGELQQLLQIEGDVTVEGDLTPGGEPELTALLAAAARRPELRTLASGIEEAEAETRLGQTYKKPEYGVGVQYSREEGDRIVLGRVTVSLPVFAKGEEIRASGTARATRLRAELEAAQRRIRLEVRSAFDAYQRRRAALRILEADALSGMDENEALTTRSFEVGQIGLTDLLLIRREILNTRFQYLDARLEAVLAGIELDAAAAVLR